ncbi:hypothetical protein G6F56_000918 [Rhizopus delemar]|nr:hypothetical protein G6F56_000918 [Rhizopus delemar]
MSCISSRFRCIGTRYSLSRHTRYFTIATPCRQTQEILPEERLKELVAELEKPLKIEDNTTVLLEAIESLQPKSKILSDKEYEKLCNRLNKSYNRKQLAEYLASKEMYEAVKSKSTKKSMVGFILQNTWSIKTVGQLRDEKRRRVTQQFPATRQELFFIIGDNGNTIRNIETKNEVNITIDVLKNQYLVEGQPLAVEKAKKDIFSHLNIIEGHIQVPKEMIENEHFRSEISRVLTDVSKVSGSYILLNDDKSIEIGQNNVALDQYKSISQFINDSFKRYSDRIFVRYYSEETYKTLTYSDVDRISSYLAHQWSNIIDQNQIVSFLCDHGVDYLVMLVAILKLGAPFFAISSRNSEAAVISLMEKTGSRLLLVSSKYKNLAATVHNQLKQAQVHVFMPLNLTATLNKSMSMNDHDLFNHKCYSNDDKTRTVFILHR